MYVSIRCKKRKANFYILPGKIYVRDLRDDSILVICDAFLSKKFSYKLKYSIFFEKRKKKEKSVKKN